MKKTTFKVWCDQKKTRFYWVHIFKDKASMYAWNTEDMYEGKSNYEAIARSCSKKSFNEKTKRWEKLREQGCVCFYIDGLGAGVVSHEFTHAALYAFLAIHKDCRKLEQPKHDEELAWTQGNMVRQFWKKWYALIEKKVIQTKKQK